MAKDVRVEIGFLGGGNTVVEVPEDQLDSFTGSLQTGETSTWFTITSSDSGTFHVDLAKVVYVRIATTSRAIGFSHV